MGYKLREIAAESKFSQELTLDAIARAVPLSEIKAALTEEAVCEQRERKLNMVMTVLVTIAMNLYTRISIGAVLRQDRQRLALHLARPGLPRGQGQRVQLSALSVGPRPLANLFHRVCRPMTTLTRPAPFCSVCA